MADRERIDPLEKKLFRLVGTYPELQGVVARILEEGAVPGDLMRSPSQGIAPVLMAFAVRAFRPPFKLRGSQLFGEPEYWEIQETT